MPKPLGARGPTGTEGWIVIQGGVEDVGRQGNHSRGEHSRTDGERCWAVVEAPSRDASSPSNYA